MASRLRLAGAALLLLLQISAFALSQQEKSSISGDILRASNGDPIAGALVTLVPSPSAESYADVLAVRNGTTAGTTIVTTGADGKFSFQQLASGSYRIYVTANGYPRQEYGATVANATGKEFVLTAGQILKDLSIRLTPAGTITGRILDDAGQPATSVPVQLLRVVYDSDGKNLRSVQSTNANDRGEFRLYGIVPGRYYINAGNPPGSLPRNASITTSYASTFFPNAADVNGASIIEIKSDTGFQADMTLKRQKAYLIRGRAVDSATGLPPAALSIQLVYWAFDRYGIGPSGTYNRTTGTFEIQNVTPGDWLVDAGPTRSQTLGASVSGDTTATRIAASLLPKAEVSVHVTDADIEGLVVTLSSGSSVTGRISLDGDAPFSSVANFDRIVITLTPSVNGVVEPLKPTFQVVSRSPSADGTFRLEGVPDGEYMVYVSIPLSVGSFYIKDVQYAGNDVFRKPMHISSSIAETIQVTLRAGAAQLTGIVTDAKSQPVPRAGVRILPELQQRNWLGYYSSVLADQDGRFTFKDIPPGNYKVFSWEYLDMTGGGFYDPEVMKQYEDRGVAIRIDENSMPDVSVKIIPAMP